MSLVNLNQAALTSGVDPLQDWIQACQVTTTLHVSLLPIQYIHYKFCMIRAFRNGVSIAENTVLTPIFHRLKERLDPQDAEWNQVRPKRKQIPRKQASRNSIKMDLGKNGEKKMIVEVFLISPTSSPAKPLSEETEKMLGVQGASQGGGWVQTDPMGRPITAC